MNRGRNPRPPGKVLTIKGYDIGLPLACALKKTLADEGNERKEKNGKQEGKKVARR